MLDDDEKKLARKIVNKKYYEKRKILENLGEKQIVTDAVADFEAPSDFTMNEKKNDLKNQEITQEPSIVTDLTNTVYQGMMGSIQTIVQTAMIAGVTILTSYLMKQQQQPQKQSEQPSNQSLPNAEISYHLRDSL